MLTHPTLDKLHTLRLTGMAKAFAEQMAMSDIETLSTEERLGLLVDRELIERENRRLRTRLRKATLRHQAAVEDIDYRHPRGLDKSPMTKLAASAWLREHLNVLITGPTGIGKSWLACALAHKACRDGFTARYLRLPRFLRELTLAKADGRYGKLMTDLAKVDLLVLDDFGTAAMTDEHRRDGHETSSHRFPQSLAERHGGALGRQLLPGTPRARGRLWPAPARPPRTLLH